MQRSCGSPAAREAPATAPTLADGAQLTVGFNGAFNRNWVHDPANRRVVEDLIFDVTGARWQLTCVVSRPAERPSLESVGQVSGSSFMVLPRLLQCSRQQYPRLFPIPPDGPFGDAQSLRHLGLGHPRKIAHFHDPR